MRKPLLFLITFVIFSISYAQESRFWVNGSGDWNDPSHWSAESGGQGGASIPSELSNVVFDNNSMIDNFTVTLKEGVECKNISILNSELILKGKKTLTVNGSIIITDGASLAKYKGDIILTSSNKSSINIPVKLNSNVIIQGKGEFVFDSNISTKKDILFKEGNLNTNGVDIQCNAFVASSIAPKNLNLGSSVFTINSWNFENTSTLDFEPGTSKIYVNNKLEKGFKGGKFEYNMVYKAGAKAHAVDVATVDATCPVNSLTGTKDDGSISVDVNGGTGNFDFRLYYNKVPYNLKEEILNSNTVVFDELESEDFKLYVYEVGQGGAFFENNYSIGPDDILAEIKVAVNISCPDNNDLRLTAEGSGGSGTYTTYDWYQNNYDTYLYDKDTTDNLGYSNYIVNITDDKGCRATDNFYYYPLAHPNNNYDEDDGRPVEIIIGDVDSIRTCGAGSTGGIEIKKVSKGTKDLAVWDVTGYGYAVALTTDPQPVIKDDFQKDSLITGLATGVYNVYVMDGNECIQQLARTVEVTFKPEPTADAGGPGTNCEGLPYTFSGISATNGTILWTVDTGTGSITAGANTLNPTYTPGAGETGAVKLLLTVSGTEGCVGVNATDFHDLTIVANPKPNAGNDFTNCGDSYTISDASKGAGGSIIWSQLDGLADGTIAFKPSTSTVTPLVEVSGATLARYRTYQLQMEETVSGCKGTDTVEITFVQEPVANAGGDATICAGETYNLNGTSVGGTVKWTNTTNADQSGFSADNIDDPVYTPTQDDIDDGVIFLEMTVTGDAPCGAPTSTMKLTILPVPTADANTDESYCGQIAQLDGQQSVGGSSANWIQISGPAGGTTSITSSNSFTTLVSLIGSKVYGTYEFELTETSGSCSDKDTVAITFDAEPIADAGDDAVICEGNAYITTTASASNAGTITWTEDGLGNITGGQNTENVEYTSIIGDINPVTLTMTVSGAGACSDPIYNNIDKMELVVNSNPIPVITGDNNVCLNETERYNTGGSSAYDWTVTGGSIEAGGDGNNYVDIKWTGAAGTITVSYEDASSCAGTSPVFNVTINSLPTPTITPDPLELCEGETQLMDVGAYNSYSWTESVAGTLSSLTVQQPVFSAISSGNITLTCTVTDNNSCQGTDNIIVTVTPAPVADAGGSGVTCEGVAHTVSGASADNGTPLWTVQTGTGTFTPGTETTLSPIYNPGVGETGAVELLLTVSGPVGGACDGAQDTDVYELTVNGTPTPNIAGENNVCINDTERYTTDAGSDYDWTVTNGDIVAGGDGSDYIDIKWTGGNGVITVSFKDGNSCAGTSADFNVTVNDLPVITFESEVNSVCVGDAGNVYTTQGSQSNYVWTVSAGGTITAGGTATDNSVTVTWNSVGAQTVSVNYENINGCTAETPAVSNVNVDAIPVPTFTQEVTQACIGDVGNVYTTQASQNNYTWVVSAGGTITAGGTATDNSVTITWSGSGAQTVSVNYENTTGCEGAAPAVSNVTVNELPLPTFIDEETSACVGDGGYVYTTQADQDNYAWVVSAGGTITAGGTATDNSVTVTWNISGPQTVSVNYENAEGCTGAADAVSNVTVHDLPNITFESEVTEACEGSTGNVYTTQDSQSNYVWTVSAGGTITAGGAVTDNTVTVTWNTIGAQTVSVNYENANGCDAANAAVSNVNVNAAPIVVAGSDTSICYTGTYTVVGASITGDYDSYAWKTSGDGTFENSNTFAPTYTPGINDQANGTVTITLEAESSLCGITSSDFELSIYPEMLASVGGVSPYLINPATTEINVVIWAEHPDMTQLSFYLVNPTGDKEIKLYDYNSVEDGCDPWDIFTTSIDSLVFSLNSEGSQGTFNLCNFKNSFDPIIGEFDPEDPWTVFEDEDPAAGGWALRVYDNAGGSQGKLNRVRITFNDIHSGTGEPKTITYDSKENLNYDITDGSTTTYIVPIGLRTSCFGLCDAQAQVSVQNGSGNYIYDWDHPEVADEANVLLCGGDFSVTVTDVDRGCTSVATVSVLEPDPILLTLDSLNVECYGDSTGMVSVKATDGELPYKYIWNDGNNTENDTVFNLPAGTYTVTVSDFNTCSTIDSVTILEPEFPITVDAVTIDSTSCNGSDGIINLAISGGTPKKIGEPYTYFLDGVPTVNPIPGLAVGTYIITIKDSLDCSLDTTIIMVDEGDIEITEFNMISEVTCNSACDGEVEVVFTGGTGDFSYEWSGAGINGNDPSLSGVCGDSTYYVTITDNSTCSTSGYVTIAQPDSVKLNVLSQSDVLCFSDSTGIAKVEGIGGSGVYFYAWYTASNDTLSTEAKADNLPFGTIYIDVWDENLCKYTDSISIDQPTLLTATKDSTQTGCGEGTGTATITPAGGTPFDGENPYTYLWDDENATTDSIATGLEVGIYNVTVTDANGCQLIESINITDNSTLLVTLDSTTDILCAGDSSGVANITVSDGTPDYTFLWSNGETDEDADSLKAGTNYVTVTDAASCQFVLEVNISEPDSLKTTIKLENDPLCYMSKDGSASVTPIGGVEPYKYLWSNNEKDSTAIELVDGWNYVTVVDINTCITIDSIELSQPDSIEFSFETIATQCGDSSGRIYVKDTIGGVGGYTVSWASPAWDGLYPEPDSINTDSVINLWVANYVAIVTDANGCSVRDSINLKDDSSLDIELDSLSYVSCYGGEDGALIALGILGTEPYSYIWTNIAGDTIDTDSLLNNAFAGTYNLQVTDAGNCRRDTAFTIIEPEMIQNNWVFTDAIECFPDSIASLYAAITGGTKDYSFIWTNSVGDTVSTDSTLIEAGEDWYYLNVKDANACEFNDSLHIFKPEPMELSIVATETSCPDSAAIAEVTVLGGVAPYSYYWYLLSDETHPIVNQDSAMAKNLWVDVFVVRVTDSLGCFTTDTVTILDDSGLDFEYNINHHVWCEDKCDAEAEVTLVTKPDPDNPGELLSIEDYIVLWDDQTTGNVNSKLCIGDQTITVIDNSNANKCKVIKPITITDKDLFKLAMAKSDNITQSDDFCLGSVTVRPTGGDTTLIDKYYVDWFNADMEAIAETDTIRITDGSSSLGARCEGWYYVSVNNNRSDLNGCSLFDSIYVSRDTLRYDTILLQNVLCYGDSTGYIEVQAQGGDGYYHYAWRNDAWSQDSTSASISNLTIGRYYLTITDEIGSIITDSIDIYQPKKYEIILDITESGCVDSTGIITVVEPDNQGGTPPYAYSWMHPSWEEDSTGMSIQNLWVDEYLLIVTDSNKCKVDSIIDVTDNSTFAVNPQSVGPEMCFGANKGELTANPTGGIEEYTFAWFANSLTDTISKNIAVENLKAGVYTLHAYDAEKCFRSGEVIITQFDKVNFTLKDSIFNTCYDDCKGSITFSEIAGGSEEGYSYWVQSYLDGDIVRQSNTPLITDLCTGDYKVRVIDNFNCQSEFKHLEFTSNVPEAIITDQTITKKASCNLFPESFDGAMTVEVQAGFFGQVSNTAAFDFDPTFKWEWQDTFETENNTSNSIPVGNTYVVINTQFNGESCYDTIFVDMPYQDSVFADKILSTSVTSGIRNDYYCPVDTVELFGRAQNAFDSVVWTTLDMSTIIGRTDSTNIFVLDNVDGEYIYRVYNNKCYDEDTLFVGRYELDTLNAYVVNDAYEIPAGQEIRLNANIPEVTISDIDNPVEFIMHDYIWMTDDDQAVWSPVNDTINPYVTLSKTSLLTLIDTINIYQNELYSNVQCVLIDTFSVEVLPDFTPPSGFTPNGDGINDRWVLSIKDDPNTLVQVYNRWGGLVWENKGIYLANEWDGTNINGKALPSGTYYYRVVYNSGENQYKEVTGPITILK